MAAKASRSMSEHAFQNHVIEGFEAQGYVYVPEKTMDRNFNRETAIDEQTLLEFLAETQPKDVAKVERQYGAHWGEQVIKRIGKVTADKGLLWTLHNGIDMAPGAHFNLLYFKPKNELNPTLVHGYRRNKFRVTEEFHYSTLSKNDYRVDVALMVNGFPLATIELKNHQTGQTYCNAIKQYMTDRNPKEKVFQPDLRSLVHFAVDADDAYMTTWLDGTSTRFLPYDQGNGKEGSGNPPAQPGKFRTSYLWEEVLTPDSLLDIVERFVQIVYRDKDKDGRKINRRARSTMKAVVFPRYHQLRAVRRLVEATRKQGPGHNYLIQHSAGSGKSYSIAWLAYHLASLTHENGDAYFDSAIVLVDRVVLDRQLQGTIMSIPHKTGLVDIAKDSAGLRDAVNHHARIIISTIQKFPYIYDQTDTAGRKFAVIIDEAHSSQSGEAHRKTKQALGDHTGLNADDADEAEDAALDWDDSGLDDDDADDAAKRVRDELNAQGVQDNLSFYAFTATPKPSTLEVFGTRKSPMDKPQPFDLYSMRQAIEEGFILDVLTNYTTFATYFHLVKNSPDDPKRKANRTKKEIMDFVKLDPSNVSKICEIIADHFRDNVMPLLDGHGKGMVVTSSRKAAVAYYRYLKQLCAKETYTGVRPVVAFSGKLDVDGTETTEAELNGFPSSEIAERFDTDEFNLMVVANKFQTGFDQPKLCAMYVDKKLTGVAAVQTLSRLNRTYPGKTAPIVLDFANKAETIQAAFEPYYTRTEIDRITDPNVVYDMKTALAEFQIYDEDEVSELCRVWMGKPDIDTMPEVLRMLEPAKDRFEDLDEDRQEEFRKRIAKFLRTYTYVTQIIRLDDERLFELDTYLTFLNRELAPARGIEEPIDGLIAVTALRIEKKESTAITLTGDAQVKNNAGSVGVGPTLDAEDYLSAILKRINELFGTDFGEPSRKFFESMMVALRNDDKLSKQAKNNSRADFRTPFSSAFIKTMFRNRAENEELFRKLSENTDNAREAMEYVREMLFNEYYNQQHNDDQDQ